MPKTVLAIHPKTQGTNMNKQRTFISMVLVSGLLVPVIGFSHNTYVETPGYTALSISANALRGISFNDPRYEAYCNKYAKVAVAQANQRTRQKCSAAIPTPTTALKTRWSKGAWVHRSWCATVSAYGTGAESTLREGKIRNCMNSSHSHTPTQSQVRKDCVANDNMHKKAAQGDVDYVLKCLLADINPDIRDGNQWTPLHSAARRGRYFIVELLISRGAFVNAKDSTGRTPLDQAIAGKYPRVEKFLKSRGGVKR